MILGEQLWRELLNPLVAHIGYVDEALVVYDDAAGEFHLQRAQGDSGYGTRLMSQLGEDLKMDPRRLYNMVEVFRAFKKLNTYSILTFSHYLEISRVEGVAERESLVERCDQEGWSVRELKAVLGDGAGASAEGVAGSVDPGLPAEPGDDSGGADAGSRAAAPVPRKGRLFTYRLLEDVSGSGKEVKLDLGFRVRLALQAKAGLGTEPGRAVECVADSKGQLEYGGWRYQLNEDNKPRTKLYTCG